MFIHKVSLPRRTFLRGLGVTVALPLLEAMVPALTVTAKTAAGPRRRVGFVYIPNGTITERWIPEAAGSGFEFTPTLKPLEPLRDSVVVVSHLERVESVNNHAVSSGCWLTGVRPRRTDGPDFEAGTSLDQVIAKAIGPQTVFPSLEVATEDFSGLVGACDPGYNCAYMTTLSWRTPTTPLPMETNPRALFDRLFGGGRTREQRLARMQTDRSILDFVAGDLRDLERGLGAPDRVRLGEYLDHVRETERGIQRAEDQARTLPNVPEAPVGVPESFDEHATLLFDLLALAYEADLTRVFTFMLAREVSQRVYPHIGVTDPHHTVSHYGRNPERLEMHARVNAYHVQLLARFLERLQSTPDGEGTLLDQSMILYGSGMSNGQGHTGYPLPLVIVGRGAGHLRGNRHVVPPEHTPMPNLLLAVADKMDVPLDRFGVSTGRVEL